MRTLHRQNTRILLEKIKISGSTPETMEVKTLTDFSTGGCAITISPPVAVRLQFLGAAPQNHCRGTFANLKDIDKKQYRGVDPWYCFGLDEVLVRSSAERRFFHGSTFFGSAFLRGCGDPLFMDHSDVGEKNQRQCAQGGVGGCPPNDQKGQCCSEMEGDEGASKENGAAQVSAIPITDELSKADGGLLYVVSGKDGGTIKTTGAGESGPLEAHTEEDGIEKSHVGHIQGENIQ